jgi:hypothetical protein
MLADPKRGHLCAANFTLMHNLELALYIVKERLQGMSRTLEGGKLPLKTQRPGKLLKSL